MNFFLKETDKKIFSKIASNISNNLELQRIVTLSTINKNDLIYFFNKKDNELDIIYKAIVINPLTYDYYEEEKAYQYHKILIHIIEDYTINPINIDLSKHLFIASSSEQQNLILIKKDTKEYINAQIVNYYKKSNFKLKNDYVQIIENIDKSFFRYNINFIFEYIEEENIEDLIKEIKDKNKYSNNYYEIFIFLKDLNYKKSMISRWLLKLSLVFKSKKFKKNISSQKKQFVNKVNEHSKVDVKLLASTSNNKNENVKEKNIQEELKLLDIGNDKNNIEEVEKVKVDIESQGKDNLSLNNHSEKPTLKIEETEDFDSERIEPRIIKTSKIKDDKYLKEHNPIYYIHKDNIKLSDSLYEKVIKTMNSDTFIGEIYFNQDEYESLVAYAKKRIDKLSINPNFIIVDPAFAIALVLITEKRYDSGTLWPNLEDELYVSIKERVRAQIRYSFSFTLETYKKSYVSDYTHMIANLTSQAFITDAYANNFFEYIDRIYNYDLKRNISNFDKVEEEIIDNIKSDDYTSGKELINFVSIKAALEFNEKGVLKIIDDVLRCMDNFYLKSIIPKKSTNRIKNFFVVWTSQNKTRKRKAPKVYDKIFDSPFLAFDELRDQFKIVFPKAKIKKEYLNLQKVYKIYIDDELFAEEKLELSNEEVLEPTTRKTRIYLPNSRNADIFKKMRFELVIGDTLYKKYEIKKSNIRFFSCDDNAYISGSNMHLPVKELYAFFYPETKIFSDICDDTDSEDWQGLIKAYFYPHNQSYIVLSSGEEYIFGDSISINAFSSKQKVTDAYAVCNKDVSVYRSFPNCRFTIDSDSIMGTIIKINNHNYLLDNCINEGKAFIKSFGDESHKNTCMIDLPSLDNFVNGYYNITIDIPGCTNKEIDFLLLNNFDYRFYNYPYVFENQAILEVDNYDVKNLPVKDKNYYVFNINVNEDQILKIEDINGNKYIVYLKVPYFAYKFTENEPYLLQQEDEFWKTKFPDKMYVKYLSKELKLGIGKKDSCEVIYYQTFRKTDSEFVVNLSGFRDYFENDDMCISILDDKNNIYKKIIQVNIETRFYGSDIQYNEQEKKLFCKFDLNGDDKYAIELQRKLPLYNSGKIPLDLNNEAVIPVNEAVSSGNYQAVLYEIDDSNVSFSGSIDYKEIARQNASIIKPYDLTNCKIQLLAIKPTENNRSGLRYQIGNIGEAFIINIKEKQDENFYQGKLQKIINKKIYQECNVRLAICSFDKREAVIEYIDEYKEICPLLFDKYNRLLLNEEPVNEKHDRAIYTKYLSVYSVIENDSEYIYKYKFV